ncbi:MAG TPA: hypothetical protein VJJ55_01210 [Candidatus Paceibacterota bacterium]
MSTAKIMSPILRNNMNKHTGLAPLIPLNKGGQGVVWVIIAALLIGGGYLVVQKSKSKIENAKPDTEQAVAPTAEKETESPIAISQDWETYRNEKYGFEVKYPSSWETQTTPVGAMFRPIGMKNDWQWVVEVSQKAGVEALADIYTSEVDRIGESKITPTPITVDGSESAMLAVVTNDEVRKMSPAWERRIILITRGNQTYTISNGAIKSDEYERFYQSFTFTK